MNIFDYNSNQMYLLQINYYTIILLYNLSKIKKVKGKIRKKSGARKLQT